METDPLVGFVNTWRVIVAGQGIIMQKDNRQSALWMMGAMGGFVLGDTCIKLLGETLPLSQIIVLRGIPAVLMVWVLAHLLGPIRRPLPAADWRLIFIRSLADVCTTFFFLSALTNMPIANATAMMLISPLAITLTGAMFLGEHVGWRRWLAVGAGFVGMLLIVQPGGAGFNFYSIYVLVAVCSVVVRDVVTRKMSSAVPSMMVSLINTVNVFLFGVVWSFFQPWAPVETDAWIWIIGAAALVVFAYICSIMTVRTGEVSAVAPFRYTGLLMALVLGWLVFDEWPNTLAFIGGLIVVISGVYALWREALTSREIARAGHG